MIAMRRLLALILTASLGASPAFAGRLDLEMAPKAFSPGAEQEPFFLPPDLAQPGSPLALRGASRPVRLAAQAGFTAMGAIGLATGIAGAGLCGAPCAVGFGVVTLLNAIGLWQTARDDSSEP